MVALGWKDIPIPKVLIEPSEQVKLVLFIPTFPVPRTLIPVAVVPPLLPSDIIPRANRPSLVPC